MLLRDLRLPRHAELARAARSVVPFVAARVLRIYPALIAATLFTIVLAGAVERARLARRSSRDPQTRRVRRGASRRAGRCATGCPARFATNPFPHAVNGSLWTLPVELRLYVAVLARRRRRAARAARGLARRAVARCSRCSSWRPDWFPLPLQRPRRARARAAVRAGLARVCVARRASRCRSRPRRSPSLLVVVESRRARARRAVRAAARLRRARRRLSSAPAVARVQPRRRLFVRPVRLFVPDPADAGAAPARTSSPLALFALCAAARRSPSPPCRGTRSSGPRSD